MDEPSSLQQFFDTTSYISATPFLSRRNPVFGVFCGRGSFFGPRGEFWMGGEPAHRTFVCTVPIHAENYLTQKAQRTQR
jgi:hypothetical protein